MCSFCRRTKQAGTSSLALLSCIHNESSDDGSSWSVSSSGTMCSEQYVRLRNRYLWSGRKEGCFKRADFVDRSEKKWREEFSEMKAQGLEQRVHRLEAILREKEKIIKQVMKENRKLKDQCQSSRKTQKKMKTSDVIVDKLRHQISEQRKQSAKIDDLLKQIEKLISENQQLRLLMSRNQQKSQNKRQELKEIDNFEKQQSKKKEVRFINNEKESHWKDNFIHVFIQLMDKIRMKQGVKVKQNKSIKRIAKSSWRFLKQFINFHYQKNQSEHQQ